MCGISGCSIAAMKWLVWPNGRIVLWRNELCSLIVEFGQQLAFWVALCVAIVAAFSFSVEHLIPSSAERVLHDFKPLLLLI